MGENKFEIMILGRGKGKKHPNGRFYIVSFKNPKLVDGSTVKSSEMTILGIANNIEEAKRLYYTFAEKEF